MGANTGFDPVLPILFVISLFYGLRGRARGSSADPKGLLFRNPVRFNNIKIVAIIVLGSVASTLINTAGADEDFNSRWYLGAGLGVSHLEPDPNDTGFKVDDEYSFGGKGYLGYDLGKRWSTEAHYADLGKAKLSPRGEVDYQVFGLSGLYRFFPGRGTQGLMSREGFSMFGRAGLGKL